MEQQALHGRPSSAGFKGEIPCRLLLLQVFDALHKVREKERGIGTRWTHCALHSMPQLSKLSYDGHSDTDFPQVC